MKFHKTYLFVVLNVFTNCCFAQNITIDILIAYTDRAQEYLEGVSGRTFAQELHHHIDIANMALDDSDAGIQFRVVHLAPVDFDEVNDVDWTLSGRWQFMLNALRWPNDGHMDELHTLRDVYGADLVALLVRPIQTQGVAGIGNLLGSGTWNQFMVNQNPPNPDGLSQNREGWSFSVTNAGALPNHTLTHELLHNLGAHHGPTSSGNHVGVFHFSQGHRFGPNNMWRTIMAYTQGSEGFTRLPYVSNPDVPHDGFNTGVFDERDNALTTWTTGEILQNIKGERLWPWHSTFVDEDGWRWSPWFSWFWDGGASEWLWIFHSHHGWLWSDSTDQSDMWIWDAELDTFLWTSNSDYPTLYLVETDAWVYYEIGTTNPRIFHMINPTGPDMNAPPNDQQVMF